MARPSLFTPARAALLVTTIRETGCSLGAAARVAGIGESTLKDWRKRGAEELGSSESVPDIGTEDAPQSFGEFFFALEHALAGIESKLTKCLVDAATKDWRAAAWWLERRRPEVYGAKVPAEAVPETPRLVYAVDLKRAEAELSKRMYAKVAARRAHGHSQK